MPNMNQEYRLNHQNKRAAKLRREVRAYKVAKGCKDCGYSAHHAGLEFDHRPRTTKSGTVTLFMNRASISKTWAEIGKCDVVCSTCHSIRTWKRSRRTKRKAGYGFNTWYTELLV